MKFFSRLRLVSARGTNRNLNPNRNKQQYVGMVADEEAAAAEEEEDGCKTATLSSSRIGICVNGSGSSSSGERNAEIEDTASSPGQGRIVEEGESSKAIVCVTNSEQQPATSSGGVEEKRNTDNPPTDDCCPICFGAFVVPCKAPCGHWYCGGCILQYWNYGAAALQPCNCPMCTRKITSLTPQASLGQHQDDDVTEILKNVRRYNRLFVGGTYGFFLKLLELPLYVKRMFHDMMNPDRPGAHLNKLRIFAMILGLIYTFSPLDFLRIGRQNVIDVFDYSAMALSFILYIFGLYHRRRSLRRVREMAAIQL